MLLQMHLATPGHHYLRLSNCVFSEVLTYFHILATMCNVGRSFPVRRSCHLTEGIVGNSYDSLAHVVLSLLDVVRFGALKTQGCYFCHPLLLGKKDWLSGLSHYPR